MDKITLEKIKTWFVTGASSGVGHEMCRQLLDRGIYNVVACARRVPDFGIDSDRLLCLSCDVTDEESVASAIQRGIAQFSKIDVLVNNAGVTSSILCEEETLENMKRVMDVNFFGTYNTIHAILPHFRANMNGTIINNSSQSGISARLLGSAYCSSKHAVEGLSDVVRLETKRFCRVMAFELGWFPSTGILNNIIAKKTDKSEYIGVGTYYPPYDYRNYANDLSAAVASIIETAENNNLPHHLILGGDSLLKAKTEWKVMLEDIKYSDQYTAKCSKPRKVNK